MAGKSLTTQHFFEKCNNIHSNKYSYSDTNFSSTRDKIIIKCPLHGAFEQRASAHLDGQGCKKCRNEEIKKRLSFTKEQFLENINDWQKANLDFSEFDYKTNKIKGKVFCKIHKNYFFITPSNIKKSKRGCPICSRNLHKELVRNSKEEFIKLSIEKHGDVFDYSEVPESFHSHDYIKIKCKECLSSFERVSYSHCNIGHTCPKCNASKTHKILENFLDERKISYKRK